MNKPTILLVEDDINEEMFALKAIEQSEIPCEILVARDGAEACHMLFGAREELPSLILLDLNLPRLHGFELLERIRETETTKRLPVIVFSDSDDQDVVRRSIDLHANSFVRKDADLLTYESRLKVLLYYWMAVSAPTC